MAKTENTEKTQQERPSFSLRYTILMIFTVLLLLSIFSHSASDFAVIEGGSDAMLENWIGNVGAYTSCFLLYFLGLAIYPLAIIYTICIFRPFIPIPTRRKKYIWAIIALSFGMVLLFAISPQTFVDQTDALGIGHKAAPHSALSGGVIGQFFAAPPTSEMRAGIIRHLVSTVGTLIIALGLIIAGFVTIWIADWQAVATTLLKRMKEKRRESEPKIKPEYKVEPEPFPEPRPIKPEIRGLEEKIKQEDNPLPDPEPEPVLPEIKPLPIKNTEHQAPQNHSPTKISKPGSATSAPIATTFTLPPISMLAKGVEGSRESAASIEHASQILQQTLESFNVDGQVTGIVSGPRVTRYEISLSPGVRVEKVANIGNNIAMELEAKSIRILAPIPGRNAVGVEAPNSKASSVFLRNVMESEEWRNTSAEIPVVLGKNVAGQPVILDLAKAPHLLIAGATGSGKSVCMNTLIMSLLFSFTPDELKLIMVDPKVVEFETYTSLPQLITPVVNDPHKVPLALRWAVNEMEKRYKILAKARTRNLKTYNSRPITPEPQFDDTGEPLPAKLPVLIIIIDELADVMMTDAKSDVETSVARIAQKGRAAGIHIVIATQRPSTNIITGVIKANLPTRIAFRVGSIVDSRVILDQKGAETLLGSGDMLFIPPGGATLERIQGAYVEDSDITKVVGFVSEQVEQQFDTKVISGTETEDGEAEFDDFGASIEDAPDIAPVVRKYLQPDDNPLIRQALEITLLERKVSTSYLQRRLKIGYNRAAEIIDIFEERGLVSPPLPGGSKREILVFDEIENGGL